MEIFNNSERSGYEEIVASGPKWWTEYREMDAVYRYEGWLLDLMAHFMERKVKNQFPSQADEAALAMYEKLLRIESDVELSLEERRRIVSAYYSGTGHLSRSVILSLVKAYTGQDGDVYWNDGTLCIEFNNNDGAFISIGILQKVIDRRMPAHIPFQTRCTCKVNLAIRADLEMWEKRFTLAGTKPKTNIGLCIAPGDIALKTAADAFETQYGMTGNSLVAGTQPGVSRGLKLAGDGIGIETETEAAENSYPVAGVSGETGTYPKESTGLESTSNSVLPEVSTENWSVSYPMCGEGFGI